jgi:hypothetical protein
MIRNAVEAFQSIFEGMHGKAKVEIFTLLTACNTPALIDVIKTPLNILNNEEVSKCIRLMEVKNPITLLGTLNSKYESISRFINEAGIDLNKNWQNSMYDFLSKCWMDEVVVECINKNVDDCPYGNVQYGALTLVAILFPGILLAFSEFCFYRYFPFGGYMASRQLGKNWPLVIKCLAFPFYAIFMAIFLLVLTTLE